MQIMPTVNLLFTINLLIFSLPQDVESSWTKTVDRNIEGWTVRVDQQLVEDKTKYSAAIKALENHLQRIKYIVPEKRCEELQKLPIWLDLNYDSLKTMQYHPSKGWLEQNGHNPKLAKHVHIPIAATLTSRRQWAKHPYVILHELAHAYHDQVLGFEHPEIKRTFENAKEKKIYEKVLSIHGTTGKHYGLTNPKEYFAESTEAYFGVNDFYPFVRAELQQHDPEMFSLLKKIWGKVE